MAFLLLRLARQDRGTKASIDPNRKKKKPAEAGFFL
jgi:hypothetical protein